MRILFLGDIMGRSGRDAVLKHLPDLKAKLKPDAVIVNAENAAGGFGITDTIAKELFAAGVHCLTSGNHVWDQKDLLSQIHQFPALLRPANYPAGTPGTGKATLTLENGKKIVVINLMARLFMEPVLDDPFAAIDQLLASERLGGTAAAIFIDFHAEASSEKMAFAHYVDGRVSAVVGTHTHIPTADCMVLTGGTAYQSDAGMCGDYDSVIGVKKELSIWKFTRKIPGERMQPAEGEATVCGTFIVTNDATGKATSVAPVRVGGKLSQTLPV